MVGVSSYMDNNIFKNLNFIASKLSDRGIFIISVNNSKSLDQLLEN